MMSAAVGPKTFICCPPPPGTPDPKLPPDFEDQKPRPRIFLPAQRDICVFDAADRIRLIIGEHPSVAQHPMRVFEHIVAKTRNAYLQIEIDFGGKQNLAKELMTARNQKINKEVAGELIAYNENPKILSLLREFLVQEQFTDLHEFVMHEYITRIIEVSKHFFQNLENTPEGTKFKGIDKSIDLQIQSCLKAGCPLEKVAYSSRSMIDNIILLHIYCLKSSTWHPGHPLSSLIQEIDRNGPLLVYGEFGKEYYEEVAFQLSEKVKATVRGEIQERSLWGWKPGAKRKPQSCGHAIVIVGARNEKVGAKGIEHIYFIDPADSSDPKIPELQKIYVMSLKRLREGILNLDGKRSLDPKISEATFPEPTEKEQPNNYALHGDPSTNYL